MQALNPPFFIANGEMMYAYGICTIEGPVKSRSNITWKNILETLIDLVMKS
jgi:hypothetical protein